MPVNLISGGVKAAVLGIFATSTYTAKFYLHGMRPFKQKVYDYCTSLVESNIMRLQLQLQELRKSMESETKSTAGDKYETGRAMIHIEQDNIRKQLSEAMQQQAALNLIDITSIPARVSVGSLVDTNRGFLFIAIGLGKVQVDDTVLFVISPNSPLGLKIKGLQQNDTATINGTEYIIKELT